MSLNDIDPKIRNIIPIIVSPKTNAKVSNIFTASGEGFSPNASLTSAFNTSGKKRLNNKGSIWINIRTRFILKISLFSSKKF